MKVAWARETIPNVCSQERRDSLRSADCMALGSITMNKASGGDGIPVELFQILKDDVINMLHTICQQMWKT